ncbi:uncharacterized protein [Drosophila bipectinata]|uniref:uncharacterized protein n=1 Tax=Drosophila bipectinata TaxID=42026 RepID=UPI001C88F185|nr:uncharacterized protein LOC108124957 [Drosophila bipectinata]
MNTQWIILLISIPQIPGFLEFNNVRCIVRDKKFMEYDYCFLKSVNRTFKYLSLKTKIHRLPIEECVTMVQIRQRENRRILYNFDVKLDGCKFLRDRSNVVANWLYQIFEPFSNMNHTCPYNHDIILEKVPVQYVNKLIQTVIPDGRFYINSSWVVGGITRTDFLIYFTKS